MIIKIVSLLLTLLLSACMVGPDYVRPTVIAPAKYKEAGRNWKIAQPNDIYDRGPWWEVFHDPQLNKLELKLNITNQTIVSAVAQYMQARALVDEAAASLYPTVSGSVSLLRQKQGSSGGSGTFVSSSTTGGTGAFSSTSSTNSSNPANTHSLFVDATWEPDIWGAAHRQIEASADNAEATGASLAAIRLSSEATLAQDYFEVRTLDNDQKILDDTVTDNAKALKLTQYQYTSGVAARSDVIQAQTQFESSQAAAINNHIARAQFEHAIAVLINVPPANFKIAVVPCLQTPPRLPVEVPSELLERRPDVAQAERLVAQANAQIGVAVSAYYPALTLSGTGNVSNPGFSKWFSVPALSWALGEQLAQTFLDGGLRQATIEAARYNYESTVANYRLAVLTAFQNVEDNLVSLRVLEKEAKVQDKAARDARYALQLTLNEYKAGTVIYTAVITAQNTALTAEETAANVRGQELTSAVGLVKALGGGWKVSSLNDAA